MKNYQEEIAKEIASMSTRQPRPRRVFYAFSGALLLSMGLGHLAIAQDSPGAQMTPQEQAAVQVVKDWFVAWNTRDPEKVASYLAPNVELRSGANSPLCIGPGPIITRFTHIMAEGGGRVISDVQAYAVEDGNADLNGQRAPTPPSSAYSADKDAVPVLSVRIDGFKNPHNPGTLLISAFLLVNSHGKIEMFWEEPGQADVPGRAKKTCAIGQ